MTDGRSRPGRTSASQAGSGVRPARSGSTICGELGAAGPSDGGAVARLPPTVASVSLPPDPAHRSAPPVKELVRKPGASRCEFEPGSNGEAAGARRCEAVRQPGGRGRRHGPGSSQCVAGNRRVRRTGLSTGRVAQKHWVRDIRWLGRPRMSQATAQATAQARSQGHIVRGGSNRISYIVFHHHLFY